MDERSQRVARWFEVPMLIVALLVLPVLAIQASDLSGPWHTLADVLDWLIWGAFLVELVVMLWIVPRRWWYLAHRPLNPVIVVFTFPLLPTIFASLRLLRLFRLLRLLRLAPLLRSAQLARQIFSLEGVVYTALLTVLTVLVGGVAFANTENLSTWEGVYWAITTATTVGYGSPAVTTTTAQVIAVVVMMVSIGFVAVITGALAERFVAGSAARREAGEDAALPAADRDILAQIADVQARVTRLEESVRARLGPPAS